MAYGITATIPLPYAETVSAVRAALQAEGFGVLTEIDMAATLKAKLDIDVAPQLILGACNPPLAHRALEAEESIGLLLPCNVTVRAADGGTSIVEALDPDLMVSVTENEALRPIASEAAERLRAALRSLEQ
ncbi:DUF302 domain-containing protein [Agrococcus sp. ProA11]|uniref:DUF302 domain-containing protein n=1 Tax=Agrococcus chionoecetis TaxID=3153752 RepID=UPI00326178E9